LIGGLYDVEREAKKNVLDSSAIKELRQKRSKPILDEICAHLEDWSIALLPKSPIGQAVGYARGPWEALNRYIDDGDVDIDNNLAERVLRTVAIGRKNWQFAGSDAGAERTAVIYSLVAIGGPAGDNSGGILSSYNIGAVSGKKRVGGLVGNNEDGTISSCYSTGSVNGGAAGGLAGDNEATQKVPQKATISIQNLKTRPVPLA